MSGVGKKSRVPSPRKGERDQRTPRDAQPQIAQPGPDQQTQAEQRSQAGADQPSELDRLRQELDETRQRYLRALADSQNAQRRAQASEIEARTQGVCGVVLGILSVLDHFDLALDQDPQTVSVDQLIEGVGLIRSELLAALRSQGVEPINPSPNDQFDPTLHQAVVQQAAQGVEPGRISSLLQPGYALGQRVIRPAKVAVAPSEPA